MKKLQFVLLSSLLSLCGSQINAQDVHFVIKVDEMTPLAKAAYEGDIDRVRKLIKAGANVNENIRGGTYYGETPLMLAAGKGSVEIIQELIKAGANVNADAGFDFPKAGKPVLRYAIDSGSLEAVNVLLKAGAQVDAWTAEGLNVTPDNRNNTLLTYAISLNKPIELIKALIQAGADVNARGMVIGWTPLMVAAYHGLGEIVQELLKAGADVQMRLIVLDEGPQGTAAYYAQQQGHYQIAAMLKQMSQ